MSGYAYCRGPPEALVLQFGRRDFGRTLMNISPGSTLARISSISPGHLLAFGDGQSSPLAIRCQQGAARPQLALLKKYDQAPNGIVCELATWTHVENADGLDLGSDFILEFDPLKDLDTSRAVNALSPSGALVIRGADKYLTVEGRQGEGTMLLDFVSGDIAPANNDVVAVIPQFRIGISGPVGIIWLFGTSNIRVP